MNTDSQYEGRGDSNSYRNQSKHIRSQRRPRSAQYGAHMESTPTPTSAPAFQFDILHWFPYHQSCQRYFLDHAQHDVLVQTFASFVNILLPFQRAESPTFDSKGAKSATERLQNIEAAKTLQSRNTTVTPVSLVPYVRRLIVTGMDVPQILHGFFGDDWAEGVGPQREQERRNYLFAAKSGGWASVKRDYDMLPLETVPFLRPLSQPEETEVEAAEKAWSEWLAFEDWMIGSRAPEHV